MKKSELKSIIKECLQEVKLDESKKVWGGFLAGLVAAAFLKKTNVDDKPEVIRAKRNFYQAGLNLKKKIDAAGGAQGFIYIVQKPVPPLIPYKKPKK